MRVCPESYGSTARVGKNRDADAPLGRRVCVCVTIPVSSLNEVSSGPSGVALMATWQMHIFSTLTLFL